MNEVVLIGRMTRDPELRRTATGVPVTSFTLAINRTFKSSDGQEADFIPCVVWNKVAENVERYCSKGALVAVSGRLQSRRYEDKDGKNVSVIEVVCNSVQFLETKKEDKYATPKMDTTTSNNDFPFDIMDDDLQF